MSKKRLLTILGGLLALAVVSGTAFAAYSYWIFSFNLQYYHFGEADSNRYFEAFAAMPGGEDSPFLESKTQEIHAFMVWNDEIRLYLHDLYDTQAVPLYVTIKAEVRDGKTVFTYDGEVTENGETRPYHEEFILNWTFAGNEELSHIEPLQFIPDPTA